jgi:hypothetical protein
MEVYFHRLVIFEQKNRVVTSLLLADELGVDYYTVVRLLWCMPSPAQGAGRARQFACGGLPPSECFATGRTPENSLNEKTSSPAFAGEEVVFGLKLEKPKKNMFKN